MNPDGNGRRRYWCAGGAIESCSGPLERGRAQSLLAFYAGQAVDAGRQADVAGARFCATCAAELSTALRDQHAWSAATGAYARS